jgi:hypothetical protein
MKWWKFYQGKTQYVSKKYVLRILLKEFVWGDGVKYLPG